MSVFWSVVLEKMPSYYKSSRHHLPYKNKDLKHELIKWLLQLTWSRWWQRLSREYRTTDQECSHKIRKRCHRAHFCSVKKNPPHYVWALSLCSSRWRQCFKKAVFKRSTMGNCNRHIINQKMIVWPVTHESLCSCHQLLITPDKTTSCKLTEMTVLDQSLHTWIYIVKMRNAEYSNAPTGSVAQVYIYNRQYWMGLSGL